MGQAAYKMVSEDPELELAGLIDPFTDETEVAGVSVFNYKEDVVGLEADVWVDFTMPKVAYENTRFAIENGFAPVVGTTGFTPEQIQELTDLSRERLGWLDRAELCHRSRAFDAICSASSQVFPRTWKSSNCTTTRKKMHRVEQQLKPLS